MEEREPALTNSTETTLLNVLNPDEERLYISFTSVFLVAGVCLNLYFICMYYQGKMRTHYNYCLMHLSIGYLIQYIGFIPYISLDVEDFSTRGLVEKHILCALKDGISVFFAGAFSTTFIASYITVVRYKLIGTPLSRFQLKNYKAFRFIVIAWCTSVLIIFPNFLTLQAKDKLPVCVRRYPGGTLPLKLYGVATRTIFIGAPFVILVVTYILTIKELCCTRRSDFRRRSKKKHHNNKKILRLFGVFILNTLLSWLPFVYVWLKNVSGHFGTSNTEEVRKARMYRFTILPSLASGMVILASGSLKWCSKSKRFLKSRNTSNENQGRNLNTLKPAIANVEI